MKRRDLKRGDKFRYVRPEGSGLNFVVGEGIEVPYGWVASNDTTSRGCLDEEVVLIDWRGQTIGVPSKDSQERLHAGDSPETVAATGEARISPAHYQKLSPEPVDVIESWGLNFRLANVLKYIARAGNKPGASTVEDLRKGLRYLKREIAAQEGRRAWE